MEGFFGALLDSMVGYKIPKTVRIRDNKLAAYACITTVCIGLYIVGWKLGVEKAYLEYEPVVGYVKLDLVGHTPQINLLEEEYCRDMKCRLCDAHDIRYPNTDTREPLVTTYVREARQQRVCHRNATECPFASPFQTALWDDYLVAGIGHFQIRLWHAVQAPTFYQQSGDKRFVGDSRRMHGRLVGKDPSALGGIHTIKDFPANGQDDKIAISEILSAAGVDLDHLLPGHIRPIRETGTTIYCHIRYFNDYSWIAPASKIRYEYSFVHGAGTEAIYEPVHLGVAWTSPVDVEERMMLTRRGIKLVWSQEGALGRQSFGAFMITMTIGLAMLHIMMLLGNFVATRLLPQRHILRRYTEEEIGEAIIEDMSEHVQDNKAGLAGGLIASAFARPRGRHSAEYGSLGHDPVI
jgi:hypothetical protein